MSYMLALLGGLKQFADKTFTCSTFTWFRALNMLKAGETLDVGLSVLKLEGKEEKILTC